MAQDISQEHLMELRKVVRSQLQQLGVQNEVHSLLQNWMGGQQLVSTDEALDVLKERGVVDQLVRSLGPAPTLPQHQEEEDRAGVTSAAADQPTTADLKSGRVFLHVRLMGGRAFTDYLTRPTMPGETLTLHGELFGQRFQSLPAAATVEPAFAGEAFFELPSVAGGGGGAAAAAGRGPGGMTTTWEPLSYLPLRQGLHLAVVQTLPLAAEDASTTTTAPASAADRASRKAMQRLAVQRGVVAVGMCEWRKVLAARRKAVVVAVQLGSGWTGAAAGLPAAAAPAGVVELQLQILPQRTPPLPGGSGGALDEALITSQQRAEYARDADTLAAFVARAKAWWGDYIRQSLAFRTRPVKVLAAGEDGVQRPACTFVRPLQLGRLLSTPREAARFVALLQPREDLSLQLPGSSSAAAAGGTAEERWCRLHTVLAAGCASKEEQAVLLCSLLLGFGLDAWVCLGRLRDGTGHTWVVTRAALATPCFWEPATGARFSQTDVSLYPYASIGCVFNHTRLYANQHEDDGVAYASFVFEDANLWRELQAGPDDEPGPPWVPIDLRPSRVDAFGLEQCLERELQRLVSRHRATVLGLANSKWDATLAHLLMPALVAYEYEAVTGEVAAGNEEFQQGVKRAVPLGWMFKGFPQHHRKTCPATILQALLEEPQVLDICNTNAVDMALALRVKVFPYPEDLLSIWVMLAVKYRTA